MSYKRATLRRAKRLAEKRPPASGVYIIDVYHAADCPKLRGGVCACRASVRPARAVTFAADKHNLSV